MNVSGRNKKCLFLSYFLIAARKKGMAIKPVKNVFYQAGFSHQSYGIQMGCFISCIKMDAYAYEHCPKRKMILSPYF